MRWWQAAIWGASGGAAFFFLQDVLPEIRGIYTLGPFQPADFDPPPRPDPAWRRRYWIATLIVVVTAVGFGALIAYFLRPTEPFQAFSIGAAWEELLRRQLEGNPRE